MRMTTISPQDEGYMQLALALAKDVQYLTDPNPRVGCVLVKNGQIVATGATQKVGGAHAEKMAIAQAKGEDLAGTTAYVTLEPCSHFGRTPPCADALIQAKVARVVVALLDPNPLVSGKGIAKLKAAGIVVDYPCLPEQALTQNIGFISRMAHQKPWAWTKIACSLDGKVALNNGESKWITSLAARQDGQHWRARSSVVLTGIGTILKDDPLLNVRDLLTERQPIRAVVDGKFCFPENAALLNGEKVWIFTHTDNPQKAERLAQKNVEVFVLPKQGNHIDLQAMWQCFVEKNVNEIHIEAGPQLNSALLKAGLIDELLIYMSPKIIGQGQSVFAMLENQSLANIPSWEWVEYTPIGQDLRLRLRTQQAITTLLKACT